MRIKYATVVELQEYYDWYTGNMLFRAFKQLLANLIILGFIGIVSSLGLYVAEHENANVVFGYSWIVFISCAIIGGFIEAIINALETELIKRKGRVNDKT